MKGIGQTFPFSSFGGRKQGFKSLYGNFFASKQGLKKIFSELPSKSVILLGKTSPPMEVGNSYGGI